MLLPNSYKYERRQFGTILKNELHHRIKNELHHILGLEPTTNFDIHATTDSRFVLNAYVT